MLIHSSSILQDSLLNAGILLLLTAAAGFLISGASRLLFRALGTALGSSAAWFFANYLTLPGVLHHELSHALAALITGARVRHFSVIPSGNSLGHVEIVPRGPGILRGLQLSFSAVAPVLFGMCTLAASLWYIYPSLAGPGWKILFWYLLVCVVLHMTLSRADWKSFLKGAAGTYLLLFAVFLVIRLVS